MKKLDPQLMLSVGVLIVSFAALFISMRQASLLNRQTEILLQQMKASAWPSLSIDMHLGIRNDSINALDIVVVNKGLGPAVVEGIKVMVDGEPMADLDEVIEALQPAEPLATDRSTSRLYKQVLSAGDEVTFLSLSMNPGLRQFLYENGDRISMEICYRSIYDEYWLTLRDNLTVVGGNTTTPVQACTISEPENFIDSVAPGLLQDQSER